MSQIVVSDSTCLIALERIQRLDLLPSVFEQIWIPAAVAAEFGSSFPWLLVRAPTNSTATVAYALLVDAGEAAAIALAAELKCEVILDDLQARRLAKREGVRCVGLLGVALRAKQAGRLAAVRPLIDALQEQNFYVSPPLVAEALRLAGE